MQSRKLLIMDINQIQVVVAFCGPSGSGKDTAVDYLVKEGVFSRKIAFADYLKQLCARVTKIPKEFFYEKKDEILPKPFQLSEKDIRFIAKEVRDAIPLDVLPYDKFKPGKVQVQKYTGHVMNTPREILQYVGTEVMKGFFGQVHAYLTCQSLKNKGGVFAISDLRFVDEVECCSKFFKFFYPIRIIGRNESDDGNLHRSEKEYKELKVFAEIGNHRTLEDFYTNLKIVMNDVKQDVADKLAKMSEEELEAQKVHEVVTSKAIFVHHSEIPDRPVVGFDD